MHILSNLYITIVHVNRVVLFKGNQPEIHIAYDVHLDCKLCSVLCI